jgi:hypothetical protein
MGEGTSEEERDPDTEPELGVDSRQTGRFVAPRPRVEGKLEAAKPHSPSRGRAPYAHSDEALRLRERDRRVCQLMNQREQGLEKSGHHKRDRYAARIASVHPLAERLSRTDHTGVIGTNQPPQKDQKAGGPPRLSSGAGYFVRERLDGPQPSQERFRQMRSLACFVVVGASLALVAASASARAEASSFKGGVNLSIKGWGSVMPGRGFAIHRSVPCTNALCGGEALFARARNVVLTAKPYQGWSFVRWRGPCKPTTKPKCTINLRRVHANTDGERVANVRALYSPVAPGLTRANPIPVGTAKNIGPWMSVRVNSANSNVPLSPAAVAGDEYFDANLTLSFTGQGSTTAGGLDYNVVASDKTRYDPSHNACPEPGPQPALDLTAPINSGQSISGYMCWTIVANDESSLELYFGSGTLDYPGTTWFALH